MFVFFHVTLFTQYDTNVKVLLVNLKLKGHSNIHTTIISKTTFTQSVCGEKLGDTHAGLTGLALVSHNSSWGAGQL